jgi:tetratricopeptide (TPR) repeat protein
MSLYQARVQERLRQSEIARAEEKARAEEATKRAGVERQRVRLTVALAASLLGLIVLGGSGGFWIYRQRQFRLAAIDTTVARIQTLRNQAAADGADSPSRREARAAADQAMTTIGELARSAAGLRLSALRAEMAAEQEQAERDQKLIAELASLRTIGGDVLQKIGPAEVDRRFARAFKRYDLNVDVVPVENAIAQLKSRPQSVIRELVGSLDRWLLIRHEVVVGSVESSGSLGPRRLIELLRGLDPEPERYQLRSMVEQADLEPHLKEIVAMVGQENLFESGPAMALLLSRLLNSAGDSQRAISVLRACVLRYPGDAWTNFELAFLLAGSRPPQTDEAISYYMAARALRPEMGEDLASALESKGKLDEAVTLRRELARVDPESIANLFGLWMLLRQHGGEAEAKAIATRMIGINDANGREADNGLLHWRSARLRWSTGDLEGAVKAYREVIRVDPTNDECRAELCHLFSKRGDRKGEIAELREAVRLQNKGKNFDRVLTNVFEGCDMVSAYFTGLTYGREDIHTALGDALGETADYHGAILAYDEAIHQTEKGDLINRAYLYARSGLSRRMAGDQPGSIVDFREAIRIDKELSVDA